MSILSLAVSPEDLERQVSQYSELKATDSFRGISALLIVGSLVISAMVSLFLPASLAIDTLVASAIVYLPIAYFVYKGHRWAMLAMIALWTLEKGYTMIALRHPSASAIIWWFVFVKYLLGAYRVENRRRATLTSDTLSTVPNGTPMVHSSIRVIDPGDSIESSAGRSHGVAFQVVVVTSMLLLGYMLLVAV